MARAFLIVLDSVGIGGAPDADQYFNGDVPDTGANTVLHIADSVGLNVPNLEWLGLGAAIKLASGKSPKGWQTQPKGLWGAATEVSKGKDTPSGHWEIAGVPVPFDWHYFPKEPPTFPKELLASVQSYADVAGTLGNEHASGTEIIERLGEEHVKTGWPICYTSADSVFQIAAHEEAFGLKRLMSLCEHIAPYLHEMHVGRVIARPFVGEAGSFKRTVNRRDFAVAPPKSTLCDWVQASGGQVHAVGKIGDIFSMRGIDTVQKGADAELMQHLDSLLLSAEEGSLVFANFVEFDSLYGHRRDTKGYARHLEWFDSCLPGLFDHMQDGDLILLTADHGNDPTWHGTDHTRERVPVLGWGRGAQAIGHVAFSDIGASVAAHLGIDLPGPGRSFL